jgi:hypothetical protein
MASRNVQSYGAFFDWNVGIFFESVEIGSALIR